MLKYAITGNIASGKSQVEILLAKKGYVVYDADSIAHEILDTITDFYGYDVFTNGKIDRKKLGELVFKNNDLKTKLEKYIHPKVKTKILEIFKKHKNDNAVFVSVPLLFEAGFTNLFDKILFISAPEEIRLNRLMQRNNLTKEEAQIRIDAQDNEEYKIKQSSYIINNFGDLAELQEKVDIFCSQFI